MKWKLRNRQTRQKTKLGPPDLEHAKVAVIVSLRSFESQRSYRHSIDEFVAWYCSVPRLSFNKTVAIRYRLLLEDRHLAAGTINVRLAAVRRLAYEAAESGLLSPDLAAGIRRVKGAKKLGCRLGNGCVGLYDLNYGDVLENDGRIRLVFKYPNDRKGFQGIAPELVPIVWGDRHYLIPADEFLRLANAINAGFEPSKTRSARFLLREGDELKRVQGQPNLPSPYSEYLLKQPIKAEISSIKNSRLQDDLIRIRRG